MSVLKLYKIEQDEVYGYDTYSDAVVAAYNENDARTMHPRIPSSKLFCEGRELFEFERVEHHDENDDDHYCDDAWVEDNKVHMVKVTLLGKAEKTIKQGVICSSFHAG